MQSADAWVRLMNAAQTSTCTVRLQPATWGVEKHAIVMLLPSASSPPFLEMWEFLTFFIYLISELSILPQIFRLSETLALLFNTVSDPIQPFIFHLPHAQATLFLSSESKPPVLSGRESGPTSWSRSPNSCSKSLLFYQNDQRNKLKITLRKPKIH